MSQFEVVYTYPAELKEDTLIVEADDVDAAEQIALDRLSDLLPEDITELNIESVSPLHATEQTKEAII